MSRGGDTDEPAWLNETTTSAAVAVGSNKEVQKAVGKAATDHVKEKYMGGPSQKDLEAQVQQFEANIDPEELAAMRKMNRILRVLFILVSIGMATVAVVKILSGPDVEIFFLAAYIIVFSVVMCCFETALPGVANMMATNFGFMYSLPGRFLFSLFVGFLCFSLKIWGIVCGSAMMAVLLFFMYVLCAYPKYEAWLRTKHYRNTGK